MNTATEEFRVKEYPMNMQFHPPGHPQVYVAEAVCKRCWRIVSRAALTPEEAKAWLERDLPLAHRAHIL